MTSPAWIALRTVGCRPSMWPAGLPVLTVTLGDWQAGQMALETAQLRKKLPIVRLAVAAVVVALVGFLVLREIGMQRLVQWFDLFVTAIRDMGPWVFFAAMTILPAVGAPLMAFNL